MKQIILDTDIGGDCDDAGALVLLKTLVKKGEIELSAVTSCTTMEGAENTVAAVLGYYGMTVPVGVMREPPFMCDGDYNRYARQIKQEFGGNIETEDAVKLMRRTLACVKEKAVIIGIGPQRNLARFLASAADEFGPAGKELAAKKVEKLVVMGGTFLSVPIVFEEKIQYVEWNILQDVGAARYVADNWPTELVYSPFELGYDIQTGRNLPKGSPARRCYDIRSGLTRSSWDLCAAYYGARGCGDIFSLSERGAVIVKEDGKTEFIPKQDGRHRVLRQSALLKEIENPLDELVR